MTFFLTYWKWIAIAVMLAASFASGWVRGNNHGTQKLVDYVQKQAEEATRITQARTKVTERVITKYLEKKGATERVTEFIDREVKVYADANPANMCIDGNWIRLHDAAAANAIPKPPAAPRGTLQTTDSYYWTPYSLASIGYGNGQLRGSPPVR